MGRKRQALGMERRGNAYVTHFRHPLTNKTVRFVLGENAKLAGKRLDALNWLFLVPDHWTNPPAGIDPDVLNMWNLECNGQSVKEPADSIEAASLRATVDALNRRVAELESERHKALQLAEFWKGSKIRSGPCPTLQEARDRFVNNFTGRDPDHTDNVGYDLNRFVERFGPATPVDEMLGKEQDVSGWLGALDCKHARKNHIRMYALKMLEDAGTKLERKKVTRAGKKKLRAQRKAIEWLERDEAEMMSGLLALPEAAAQKLVHSMRVKKHLKAGIAVRLQHYFVDLWKVQVSLGLRPSELPTLQKSNFTADLASVTLAGFDDLTLKTGPRTLNVPEETRKIIRRRLWGSEIVFPDWRTEAAWTDRKTKRLFKLYNKLLKAACTKAAFAVPGDCRLGRRTCGSLLLRAGLSIEHVSAFLGDDPETVREHYASIKPSEIHPTAAAI